MASQLKPSFLFALLATLSLISLVLAQSDQTGFISLDCGLTSNETYVEPITGLKYTTDANYIDTGESHSVSSDYLTKSLEQQLATIRSFPYGVRNCYNISSVVKNTRYLIRASFLYANYDNRNFTPSFELHFGPNLWDSINFTEVNTILHKEIIHIPSSNYVEICLVNTNDGNPFISSIELRPLKNTTYVTQGGASLSTFLRLDIASTTNKSYRYNDDVFDRIWVPAVPREDWTTKSTNLTIDPNTHIDYQPPRPVMASAAIPKNESAPMEFILAAPDNTTEFYVYMYFVEFDVLTANENRSFTILLNGLPWLTSNVLMRYLSSTIAYSINPISGSQLEFSLISTDGSTLPPILNAIEIYTVINFPQSETDQGDVGAMLNIKGDYGIKKNWQGDPCVPIAYIWEGIGCNNSTGSDPPKINSLNLSSSELTGQITSDFTNLQFLEILDLSNNNLSGPVPDFLAQLSNLRTLNLRNNNFSGTIPAGLTNKTSLTIIVDGNPNLGLTTNTTRNGKKKKSSVVGPVVGSVVGVIVVALIIAAAIIYFRKKKNPQGATKIDARSTTNSQASPGPWVTAKRDYSYSEILSMTNNFATLLGEGGFGKVYHGRIDKTEVAVKMLSEKSAQGYQQFQAEVELLLRVHHRNLTSLVGYCNEGTSMGLIYEYMGRGDLGQLLSGREGGMLGWKDRLQIAVDSAQGLEYLHYGCKPGIVHRDVKCTNILLNENFQAKIADFGLSRAFPMDGHATHITTNVVGTPGYLDPEYYTTYRLTEKSDVYSFGIVLLEIITGRAVITKTHEKSHISQWVDFKLGQGDIHTIIDARLTDDFDGNSVWKAVEVAMSCASHNSSRRPTMSLVATELKECLAIELSRSEGRQTDPLLTSSSSYFDSELGPTAR